MKIFLVIPASYDPDHIGGVTTYTITLADHLNAQGHTATVICPGTKDAMRWHNNTRIVSLQPAIVQNLFFRVTSILLPELSARIMWMKAVYRYAQGHRFDMLETSEWGSSAMYISMKMKRPVVVRLHKSLLQYKLDNRMPVTIDSMMVNFLEILSIFMASSVTYPSKFIADTHKLIMKFRTITKKMDRLIPNGVPLPKKHQKISNQQYVLSVGRLEWGKGVDKLIHAFSLIADTIPKMRLIIIGRDTQSFIGGRWSSMRQHLQSIIDSHNLRSRIILYPQVPHHKMPIYYRSCLCYVTASGGFENQPMSLLDAVAANKAIVAFNSGGIGEIITHGSNGFLAEKDDVYKMGQLIQSVLLQPEIRKSFERKNFSVRRKYDIFRTGELTALLYTKLLTQYHSSAA